MKKKFFLKGLLVSFMLLCSAHIWAYDFEVDNIQYTITSFDDLTVEVSGLTDTDVTEVIIPETVEYRERPLTVTSIGSKAFQSNKTLEYASISNTITSIGTYAFDGCSALKEVIIGQGVTSIGSYAFRNCTSLLKIIIPDFVTRIEDYTFYGCSSLTEATIPNSVTNIGSYAFSDCSSLENVTIGNSVERIGSYAFYNCSSLVEVTIPNSVTSIGSYVFSDCSSLTEVTFPNSITSIVSGMFSGCSSLTEATIPNSVTNIGSYAFQGCSSLTEVTIPNSVTSIGDYAFQNCSSLKELYIPDSTTSLGEGDLLGCTSLESFSIGTGIENSHESFAIINSAPCYYPLLWRAGPDQMKNLILRDGHSSFGVRGYASLVKGSTSFGCPSFSNIDVSYYYVGRPLTDIKNWLYTSGGHNPYYSFSILVSQPYGTIGTLEIGGYCTDVPYFYQSIENLILDKNVMTYEVENIYQGGLKNIVCESATPPTLVGTFDNSTYLDVVLSVPVGYKEFYQSAEGWRNFWTIQEVVISGVDDIVNSGDVTEVGRYTTSGQKINSTQKGINIVRYSDGSTRKILVQ